jgi:hypothetical protein
VRAIICLGVFHHVSVPVQISDPEINDAITISWIYASMLAYIVDANNGRSATAAAANSAFRGVLAFVATETAVPMQVSTQPNDLSVLTVTIAGRTTLAPVRIPQDPLPY